MKEQCGTPAYIAPEILGRSGYRGYKADAWSAGVTLYAMLNGTIPFKHPEVSELHRMIKKGKYSLVNEELSKEAQDLMKGMI